MRSALYGSVSVAEVVQSSATSSGMTLNVCRYFVRWLVMDRNSNWVSARRKKRVGFVDVNGGIWTATWETGSVGGVVSSNIARGLSIASE